MKFAKMHRTKVLRWEPLPKVLAVLLFTVFISDVGKSVTFAQNTLSPNKPPRFLPNGDLTKFSIPEDTPVGSVIYR